MPSNTAVSDLLTARDTAGAAYVTAVTTLVNAYVELRATEEAINNLTRRSTYDYQYGPVVNGNITAGAVLYGVPPGFTGLNTDMTSGQGFSVPTSPKYMPSMPGGTPAFGDRIRARAAVLQA